MQGIKNIIFDLGGVIINLDNQKTEDAFVALGVKNFREYFGHGHAADFFKEYEVGKISDQEFVDSLKKLAGLSVSDEKVIDGWNALLLDFPPARIRLLKDLAKRYRIFLFSNTNALHLAALQKTFRDAFDNKELDDHFERAYYSHILGLRKPAIESYQHILRENQLKGDETLFVDDAKINIEGAEAAGLKGLWLQPGVEITHLEW
jgi:HAD superfamily hydrolase (TIGR01509 family)